MLKKLFRKHARHRSFELTAALTSLAPGELVREIAELFVAGELYLRSPKKKLPLCERFYRYDKANPLVGGLFLNAAQALKREQHRRRYSIRALLETIRWDLSIGVVKTGRFKISNDFEPCYVRKLLMREPGLCGFFELKPSAADALIVDGCSWSDFAREHAAELWPGQTGKKKGAGAAPPEPPLSEDAA
jgi:hypothetical protein